MSAGPRISVERLVVVSKMHFVNIFTRKLPESGASGPPAVQAALARPLVLGCFSVFLLLSGCGGTEPVCDSLDTRNSVVKIVSDDNNNALVNYAAKNSSSVAAMVDDKSEAEKSAIWEKARQAAVYRLDDTILKNSRNRSAQEVTCIGLLYVTVADATAQKEVEFKVKQTADGKSIVSVNPFLF
jgi:hypothetical protein